MMVKPTVAELLKKAKNRYELVIATSKRARQIAEGKVEIVEPDQEKEDRIERGEE